MNLTHTFGQPTTRHEVAQVLERGISDQEACECTIGSQAGAGLGASLNPISAFVHDAANIVLFVTGSKLTKKSRFMKSTFLPFLANEVFANLNDKEQESQLEYFKHQLSVKSFEIQDEVNWPLMCSF